jgi:regulatory protein
MTKQPPFRRRERTVPRPLDRQMLTDLAYFYAGRFAVTEARLKRYLILKVRQRGWAEDSQYIEIIEAMVERLVELHAVDDRTVAVSTIASAQRKGLAGHRVRAALAAKQVKSDVAAEALQSNADSECEAEDKPLETARRFAQRKRLGVWRTVEVTPERLKKEIATMIRAGHSYSIAWYVVRETEEES